MLRLLAFVVALVLVAPCAGQGVKLPAKIDTRVGKLVGPIEVEIDGKMEDYQLLRQNIDDAVLFQVVAPEGKGKVQFVFQANRPGTYYLLVTASKGGKYKNAYTVLVADGEAPPQPTPPGPQPGPGPAPAPVPQPITGFRAVLVYESMANNTKEQEAAMYSPKVAAYLDAKCTDGKNGWRRFDQNVDNKYAPQVFKDIMTAAKPLLTKIPAVVVMAGTKGEVFPFADEASLLQILKRYGGE